MRVWHGCGYIRTYFPGLLKLFLSHHSVSFQLFFKLHYPAMVSIVLSHHTSSHNHTSYTHTSIHPFSHTLIRLLSHTFIHTTLSTHSPIHSSSHTSPIPPYTHSPKPPSSHTYLISYFSLRSYPVCWRSSLCAKDQSNIPPPSPLIPPPSPISKLCITLALNSAGVL